MDIFEKHITDLARRSFEKGYSTFSEFLTLDEINVVKALKLPCEYSIWGGYSEAERCIIKFGDDSEYPVSCIKITPVNQKFADKLNHRDFLGSLMNLGINRNTLGDIIIRDNVGYLFCLESMSKYITDALTRIKHTTVKCEVTDSIPDFINELPEVSEIIVSSSRADAVISAVYNLSRSSTSSLFSTSRIFINSRPCTKEAAQLKEKDRVSVRGYGKFIFEGEIRRTKKERVVAEVRIYK